MKTTLNFPNVALSLISYGSALCIGIEAQTPLPESDRHADKKASAELAAEAIGEAANRFYNAAICNGDATETHERFAYITVAEKQITKKKTLSCYDSLLVGLENLLTVEDQRNRTAPGWTHASKADIRAQAESFLASVPREVSFLSRLTLRNQANHSTPSEWNMGEQA